MKSGGCNIQQALTFESANMVKQAMALARRRGHAQVTPLHMASTMLSSSTGLLRTACRQSNTHPLQCRALELCFNVSLNRLPTSTGSSILVPCISNALVAVLKRAQAHHRRGSIENQQQAILAEELIISVLDDPGVSRVMREAGFSSPQVKSKVEHFVSLEICTNKPKSSSNTIIAIPGLFQLYKNENQHKDTDSANSVFDSIHKTLEFPSLTPSSSSSNSYASKEANLRVAVPEHDNELTAKLLMSAHPASSCDAVDFDYASRFKEMNSENFETLCDALRNKVPRQENVIPDIARAILKCRSGSTPRKLRYGSLKEETWLIFQGVDVEDKEKIGRELAKLVFGSQNSFVSIMLSSFSSSSMEDLRKKKKRKRDEDRWSNTQRLFEAVSCDPHRVFYVEDIEEADYFCGMGFKRAIERGRLQSASGEEAFLRDAIVILSCGRSRPCSPPENERKMKSSCISLDLNLSLDQHDDAGHCSDHIGLLDGVDAYILFSQSST